MVPSTSQLVDADAFPEADAYIDVPDDPAPMVPVLGCVLKRLKRADINVTP